MKLSSILILFCLMVADADATTIRLELTPHAGHRLLLTVMDSLFLDRDFTDTIAIDSSPTDYQLDIQTPRLVALTILPISHTTKRPNNQSPKQPYDLPRQVSFVVLPGHDIAIRGSLAEPLLLGDDFYEQQNLSWQQVHAPSLEQYRVLFGKSQDQASAKADFQHWQTDYQQRALQFIMEHPDWDASAALLYQLSEDALDDGLATLTDGVRLGPLHLLVSEQQKKADRRHSRLMAAAETRRGMAAPDFALSDSAGTTHRLSDLHGRYVIIDFWASWCVPCREGMPRLKTFASQHADRLAVMGVATWDVDEGWRRALRNLQLPWVNVFCKKDVAPDAAAMYAVKALPTKVLIGPDGYILLRQEGEDETFYEQIEQIINSDTL